MVCPTLISVSLTPGPYCFWASAGCADNAASAKPSSPAFLTNIGFLQVFCCGGSVSERRCVGKRGRGIALDRTAMRAARRLVNRDAIDRRAGHFSSHSSEYEAHHIRKRSFALLDTGSLYRRPRCPRGLATIRPTIEPKGGPGCSGSSPSRQPWYWPWRASSALSSEASQPAGRTRQICNHPRLRG